MLRARPHLPSLLCRFKDDVVMSFLVANTRDDGNDAVQCTTLEYPQLFFQVIRPVHHLRSGFL